MTQPLVSPKCDVWETSTEIPYCYSVRTWIWVLLLIGSKSASTNQKHSKNSRHAPGRLCSWKYLLISFWCEIEQAHSTIIFIQNEIRKMVNVESFWQSWSWFSIPMLQNCSSSFQPWSSLSKLPFSTNIDQENNLFNFIAKFILRTGFWCLNLDLKSGLMLSLILLT